MREECDCYQGSYFIDATAIIVSVGIVQDDTLTIFPFYKVDFHDETGQSKRILVNYTFGKQSYSKGRPVPRYESQIGAIKERMFTCIGPTRVAVMNADTCETLRRQITAAIANAEPDSLILFVFPRSIADDEPFFQALGLVHGICRLSDLGLKVRKPFIETDEVGVTHDV